MARPTDANREVAALPPGELLRGIQEIAGALRFGKPLTEDQQSQVTQLMEALATHARDVFARMKAVEEEVQALDFHNKAAKHLILAEISRYFTLVDKTERTKCWDRLHRALVDQPPRGSATPSTNSARIGGHTIDGPEWLG